MEIDAQSNEISSILELKDWPNSLLLINFSNNPVSNNFQMNDPNWIRNNGFYIKKRANMANLRLLPQQNLKLQNNDT